jgi:hypothetical protein
MTARTTPKTHDRLAGTSPWRPPTRRTFFGMLGAAAAAFTVRSPTGLVAAREVDERIPGQDGGRRRQTGARKTIWVGHC